MPIGGNMYDQMGHWLILAVFIGERDFATVGMILLEKRLLK